MGNADLRQFTSSQGKVFLKHGNTVLFVDQIVSSASNLIVLLIAARLLGSVDLSVYALFQLIITTVTGLQRSVLLAPALAAQKVSGRGRISATWVMIGPGIGALVAVPLVLLALVGQQVDQINWITMAAVTTFVVLTQDLQRYIFFSRRRESLALALDVAWLVSTLIALAVLALSQVATLLSVAAAWAGGGLVSIILGSAILTWARSASLPPCIPISETWKLGRWASVDAGLSAVVNLVPMFVATVAIGSSAAGTYRILQAALGPLNLLNTTIVLRFGLDSWQLGDIEGVRRLGQRVKRLYRLLLPVSLIVVLVVEPLVLLVSGIAWRDAIGMGLVVGAVAMMGAWVSPRLAAAQALGYQRFGAYIRLVGLLATAAVSTCALTGWPFSMTDPIGPSMVVSSLIGLVGWQLAYRRAMDRESQVVAVPLPRSISTRR